MVEVRISRVNVEALADEGLVAGVLRQDIQVLGANDSASEVRASRVAVEVLAPEPITAGVLRQDIQVLSANNSPSEVRFSRIAIEALLAPTPEAAVLRQDIQVLGANAGPSEVRVSRLSVEALARQGSAGPVTPLAEVDDLHIFLHNWATNAELSTAFRNTISPAPDSGAESRRGLGLKPLRSMKLEWLVCPGTTLDDLERLEVMLRRMTDQRFQVPIYMDQSDVTTAASSGDLSIQVATRRGRFFPGARVAIVRFDASNQIAGFSTHIINTMTNTELTFASMIGVNIPLGSVVFPLMDCEVALEVEAQFETARVPVVKLTVIEAPGASQLPPLKSDLPTGANTAQHDSRPVWFEEPDWSRGISKGRSRQGSRSNSGRADFLNAEGSRSRQTHNFTILGNREDMWNALEFFETRRGRLRSFWHIDQDQYMETIEIDTATGASVGVSEIGSLADFQEEFDAVGIVMADGSHYVSGVANIQAILTKFVITPTVNFPAGLQLANVVRIARARLCRFASDEFTEKWTHTGLMDARIEIIEILNENDFTI